MEEEYMSSDILYKRVCSYINILKKNKEYILLDKIRECIDEHKCGSESETIIRETTVDLNYI